MSQTILLLTPIYITLFWAIALTGNKKKDSVPQRLLSKFMLLPAVGFISLYLYFIPYPPMRPFIDCALQYALCFVFPLYYIYFRLLTVDVKFSFKAHARYFFIPFLLATAYLTGVLLTSWMDYTEWLTNDKAFSDSSYIQFLNAMRLVIRIHFIIQFLATVIGNQLLIHKYGVKAEQFYSDMEEENYKNAKTLNASMALILFVSAIVYALDSKLSLPKNTLLYTTLSISSIMLFIIGYLGIKQKPINPTFELTNNEDILNQMEVIPVDSRKKIVSKILVQFDQEKIYLNNQLNIMDIVQAVGTNRTYISSIINQQYNQNFCSFVNSYRIVELERILVENADYTNEVLADSCGFGSLNSLKRALFAKTGLTLPEWKKQLLTSKANNI